MAKRHHSHNLIAERLDQRLRELGHGAMLRLLDQLRAMNSRPGFEGLSTLDKSRLSKIRHGQRQVQAHELLAIAEALEINPLWLAGLHDDPAPVPGTQSIRKAKGQ